MHFHRLNEYLLHSQKDHIKKKECNGRREFKKLVECLHTSRARTQTKLST